MLNRSPHQRSALLLTIRRSATRTPTCGRRKRRGCQLLGTDLGQPIWAKTVVNPQGDLVNTLSSFLITRATRFLATGAHPSPFEDPQNIPEKQLGSTCRRCEVQSHPCFLLTSAPSFQKSFFSYSEMIPNAEHCLYHPREQHCSPNQDELVEAQQFPEGSSQGSRAGQVRSWGCVGLGLWYVAEDHSQSKQPGLHNI